jgi:hypothetical protein
MGRQDAQGRLPTIDGYGGGRRGRGGPPPFAPFVPKNQHNAGPKYSNIIKQYANWNVCFLVLSM